MTEKAKEMLLRRRAKAAGYALVKSRARIQHMNDQGGFRIIDPDLNAVVAGERFDFDLSDVEDWLAALPPAE